MAKGVALIPSPTVKQAVVALIGLLGPHKFLTVAITQVRVKATADLLIRSTVVVGEAAGVPTDKKGVLTRGSEQDETVRLRASRAP